MARVLITDHGFPSIDPERKILSEIGVDVSDVQPICKTEDDVISRCADAEVLLVQWAPITRKVLQSLPNLKLVVRYGIGVNNVDLDAAREQNIMVANIPDYCLEEVSNHAAAMVISLAKRIPQDNDQIKRGGWGINPFLPIPAFSELTLGLIGFGNIARRVAEKLTAFNFKIVASDPFVNGDVFDKFGVEKVDFDTLIGESDIISVHCPLMANTTHLINRDVIARMKRGAILVNTSRGPIVDESALIEALKSGKLCGAGIDVYEVEPLAQNNVLRSLTNVILTSHAAAVSTRAEQLLQIRPAEAARDFLQGKRPKSVVAG